MAYGIINVREAKEIHFYTSPNCRIKYITHLYTEPAIYFTSLRQITNFTV